MRHDGARSDDSATANVHTFKNDAVISDPDVVFDNDGGHVTLGQRQVRTPGNPVKAMTVVIKDLDLSCKRAMPTDPYLFCNADQGLVVHGRMIADHQPRIIKDLEPDDPCLTVSHRYMVANFDVAIAIDKGHVSAPIDALPQTTAADGHDLIAVLAADPMDEAMA
jgi:hypothetical protein